MIRTLHSSTYRNFNLRLLGIAAVLLILSFSTEAQVGKSLNFDGVDDYAITANDVIGVGSYTKEVWIRIPNPSTGTYNILSQNNAASSLFVYAGYLRAGQNPSYPQQVIDPTPLVGNTWYHVAVTFDATTLEMKLYTNGVLVSSATNVNLIASAGEPLRIGATDIAGYGMSGDMDEVRIWNYVRSASEIANNECSVSPNSPGLVLYYDFEQGTANGTNTSITSLVDRTANGNDATLSGFALTGTSSNFTDAFPAVCSVVPVTFQSFEAKANQGSVNLQWKTASESNNAGFEVERSANGSDGWVNIGFVAGIGNSTSVSSYSYADNLPAGGANYYRLVQKDFDGHATYSKVVYVSISGVGDAVKLYPTMANSSINLSVHDKSLLQSRFIIFDNSGKRVLSGIIKSGVQPIDISALNKGIYFLKTQNGTALKFLKQ